LRILRFLHSKADKEKQAMLRKIAIFKDNDQQEISTLSSLLEIQHYLPNQILFHEGDKISKVYFVKQGKCVVSATCLENGETFDVKLGILREGDYIGEITAWKKGNTDAIIPFSVIALESVEMAILNPYDARVRIGQKLKISDMWILANDKEKVKRELIISRDKLAWIKYKKRCLKKLYKEKEELVGVRALM
jgi:CRP-like cAMP-binding protein